MSGKIPDNGFDFLAGETLLIDKPKDWTSFDVVNKVRHRLKRLVGVKKIKVGHSGTLDPLATGLLIICTGKSTKKLHEYQDFGKTYTGSLLLGATTPSYDAETSPNATFPTDHIDEALIQKTLGQFVGPIEQIPPMYSAIKVDGQALYKRARKGETIKVKSRSVEIFKYEIASNNFPTLDFEVDCSKGTYIRSLAHDLGKALDSGAYLTELCRTKVGPYLLEDAWNLEELITYLEAQTPEANKR